jgi:hypothetical protein
LWRELLLNELSIVVGVSTVLGLAGLAMWLYYLLENRRLEHEAADSIAEDLEGPAKLKADSIVRVILSFKDEEKRLKAIEAFTGYDERKAKIFVKAQDQKAPVAKLRAGGIHSDRRMKWASVVFGVFLVIGGGAHLIKLSLEPVPQPGDRSTQIPTSAPATPASASVPASAPSSAPASTAASASSTPSPTVVRAPTQAPTPVVPLAAPNRMTLEFESGPKDSGPFKQFSGQYEVCSRNIPAGYRIDSVNFRLVGDRACHSYATCTETLALRDKVCYSFSLQGHEEIAKDSGIRQTNGILTVVVVRE